MSPTPAEREKLAAQTSLTERQRAAIDKKLDALDKKSSRGAWTRRTLEMIAAQPGIVTRVLLQQVNGERFEFKGLVLELRNLGLIYTLDVGFSLSPRGRAYLKSASGEDHSR